MTSFLAVITSFILCIDALQLECHTLRLGKISSRLATPSLTYNVDDKAGGVMRLPKMYTVAREFQGCDHPVEFEIRTWLLEFEQSRKNTKGGKKK